MMVVLSFTIQLFLLLTGHLRRRSINGLLRVAIWLAYVAADFVAVYALGLFSQCEEKYRFGRDSFGDTSTFLWVPFLLVHLGGQDSITAFSVEDNNLWLRHLLNLGVQVTLAMAVFWKSFHRISSHVLIPASFVFITGVIKYGERIWALRTGSRDGLGKSSRKQPPVQSNLNDNICCSRARASYALQIVHHAQGLFVGRTMLQLGRRAKKDFENYCQTPGDDVEEKLKIVMMEIGMMFDLLYTKAMVLQRLTGRIFRCAAQISMVVAFVLFLIAERQQVHNQNRANIAVSYTLFVGAIFMEVCSIATEITSPWTRAHLKEDSFLHQLFSSSSNKAFCDMKAIIQCKNNNVQWLSSCQYCSMGQFNFTDFSISHASTSTVTCKVVSALGLRKQWGNIWFMKRVEAHGIARYFVEWFDSKSPEERFRPLRLGRRLNYTLCLPFEHALYRLHIYTDLHISRNFDNVPDKSSSHADDVMLLKEECEKLSNYMCYLKSEYPSMLPISSEVRDGTVEPEAQRWKKNCGRLRIVEHQAGEWYNPSEPDSACPFEPVGESEADLKQSLEEIREMWMRLLIYAAGKCSGEQHARQLSKGGELLTFVWLLMLHHGLGDAATEVKLLTSDDPNIAELGSVVAAEGANFARRPEEPRYAFDFRQRQRSTWEADQRQQLVQLASTLQHVVPQVLAQGMMENGQELISELIQQLLSCDSKDHSNEAPAGASPERDQLQLARQIEHTLPQLLAKVIQVNATEVIDQINKQFLSGERQDSTSSEAEKEDDTPQMSDKEEETREGTPLEIVDEEVVSSEVEREQHQPVED